MKKENNIKLYHTKSKKILFQETLEKLFLSFDRNNNKFVNFADNEYIFSQLNNYVIGKYTKFDDDCMFYYFKTGNNLNNPNYDQMKILMNLYNFSQFQNLKKEYDLSHFLKLKTKNDILVLSHYNHELNKFLNGGINQGLHYALYGNSLSGKTYFLKSLIVKNIEELIRKNSKILIISTNGSFSYSLLRRSCNKNFSKKVNEVIDIVRFRTDNEVFNFLLLLNRTEKLPYSFIFIDNVNKLIDKKKLNLNTLNVNIENLKKNKNIGVVSIIYKDYNNRIEIEDFKGLICSDPHNSIMLYDFQFNFFNYELNLRLYNMKIRKYFLKIYNYCGEQGKNNKAFDVTIRGK